MSEAGGSSFACVNSSARRSASSAAGPSMYPRGMSETYTAGTWYRPCLEWTRPVRLGGVAHALAVHGLEKRYGSVRALKGVDLSVEEGELVGLLGPNGAGKSTLVKIAVGLVRATRGRAEVAGARAGSRPARAELGYLAELFRFPGWYTADERRGLHHRLA